MISGGSSAPWRSLYYGKLLVKTWDFANGLNCILLTKNTNIILSSVNQMSTVTCGHTLRQGLLYVLLLRIIMKRCLAVCPRHTSVNNQGLGLINLRMLHCHMLIEDLTIESQIAMRAFNHWTVSCSPEIS